MANKPCSYPSDVSDEEWAFCAPYLTLMCEQAPQRKYSLREIFTALRGLVRAGRPWRMMPHDLPPWPAVQQQTQRWVRAGSFEAIAQDLRLLLRLAAQRTDAPSAAILDSRTLQSTPESGARAGCDGHKKRKGSKVHVAVAFVDQGYTGEKPAEEAAQHGLRLEVVKDHEAKRGFVLLPRRWGVERTFAWAARFRRLARDYERLAATLAGYHWLAVVILMLQSFFAKSP